MAITCRAVIPVWYPATLDDPMVEASGAERMGRSRKCHGIDFEQMRCQRSINVARPGAVSKISTQRRAFEIGC